MISCVPVIGSQGAQVKEGGLASKSIEPFKPLLFNFGCLGVADLGGNIFERVINGLKPPVEIKPGFLNDFRPEALMAARRSFFRLVKKCAYLFLDSAA